MKTKSKWKGALLATMALILALSLAVVGAPGPKQADEAEALDLIWSPAEGMPAVGLPVGAGALIDVAVIPGTSTVFVVCDLGLGPGTIVVFRSDDGGLSWGTPVNLGPAGLAVLLGVAEEGVAIVPSPNYSQDGTVHLLTNDTGVFWPGTGYVYTSDDKGVTWVWATVALPTAPTCMSVDPNFNSLLSGGTIVVGTIFGFGPSSVYYETWQSPVVGWTPAWTAVPVVGFPDTLAVKYAPTSSVRLIAVMNDNLGWAPGFAGIWGVTGSIITGFPALAGAMPVPAVTSNGAVLIHASLPGGIAGAATSAVIALGTDYDPVSTPACPNCPMYFFVGTDGVAAGPPGQPNVSSSTFGFDPLTSPGTLTMVDLKAASTLPAIHWATSGLVARGMYNMGELLAGSANAPVTYRYDVGIMAWDNLVRIAGNGGPIGTISNNVGVKLAYGSDAYAITTQVPASAYGVLAVATPGDLACLSSSADFGASWSDTCLTQENFRAVVLDTAWISSLSGFIVAQSPTGQQSVFKCPMLTQWKRVDRWQGVQRIAVSTDGAAIFLLDTGMTGGKVLRSLDLGETFTPTTADPVAIVTIPMTAIAAGTANDIFVGDWNGHIYVTHDGGVTWTDAGQVASAIKSLDVPRFYAVVKHVIAGVDTLVGNTQNVIVSKDDGATWNAAGIAMWGGGGFGAAGHIEAKFSPMYNGATENLAYAGINGTFADDMYRADLSALAPWTRMGHPLNPFPVSDFDIVHVTGIVGDAASNENILYVALAGSTSIVATYYPELVSTTLPLWRFDLAAPVLWGAAGGAALWNMAGLTIGGNTLIPCPFDVVVGAGPSAGSSGPVTIFGRDQSGLFVGLGWSGEIVWNLTETTAFLTPINMHSPANGAIVPSNNLATGEPVELQWPMTPGAMMYDVQVVTDITNPSTALIFATTVIPLGTEMSIGLGILVDGQTYWWRTRVANTTAGGDHTGPWSAWLSFTVEAVEMHQAPALISPAPGTTGAALSPGFSWGTIQDADGYEFQLATDGGFTNILDEQSLPGSQTSYGYTGELERETSYFWRVRGTGGTGIDAWQSPWASAAFSTMEEPPPTPGPPVIVQEGDTVIIEEVGPDTPGWVWALIAVGGVLAVVVIVLIMRTRRPV